MAVNKKNIVTTIIFAGLMLPFIFITDFFPFLRFGMFAEPIKTDVQKEQFVIYSTKTDGTRSIFNSEEIGINPNTFHYLCRNYYYRNEMDLFSEKIFHSSNNQFSKIEIIKTTANNATQKTDSLKIGIFINHE